MHTVGDLAYDATDARVVGDSIDENRAVPMFSGPVDIRRAVGHLGVMPDPYDLNRFVVAQDRAGAEGNYEAAVRELRAGIKRSHWMWYIFPQLRELGYRPMAKIYGISSRDEAAAYLAHDVLGPRLRRCAKLVVSSGAVTAVALMGDVDAMKLRSSMTLFAVVAEDYEDFVAVLRKFYPAGRDPKTLKLLKADTEVTTPQPPDSSSKGRRRFWSFHRGPS